MLIVVGERRDGLYYLCSLPKIKAMKVEGAAALELWHKRLGHPSEKVTKLLGNVDFKNNVLDKHYDVCLKAKQTQEKFLLSDNKASGAFGLIYCDLLGPYRTPSSCGASYFMTVVDDYSQTAWVFLLVYKKEVSGFLKDSLPWWTDNFR